MCLYHASGRTFLGLFNSCQSFGSNKRGQRVSDEWSFWPNQIISYQNLVPLYRFVPTVLISYHCTDSYRLYRPRTDHVPTVLISYHYTDSYWFCTWFGIIQWSGLKVYWWILRDTTDNRPEEKFTTVWPFLFAVFLYFFNIETAEVVFSAYIYDYGRCSKYQNFGDGNGAVLPAIFWVRASTNPFQRTGSFTRSLLWPEHCPDSFRNLRTENSRGDAKIREWWCLVDLLEYGYLKRYLLRCMLQWIW